MGIYSKSQEMVDQVVKELVVFKDLIGERDESKVCQYGFIPGINMRNETVLVEELIHQLREGIFQVLFTGGFSSGKSTLLNALMRKALLKMNINAETAVVTKLVFNTDEKVIVYKKNVDQITGKPLTEEMTVEKFFEKYRVSQENPDMFIDVDYVQLQQPQDGIGGSMVQLVDSPGTSQSVADTEAARNFAKKASAIVYLINAVQPFTQDDKEYINSHYAGKNFKNLFFVINRFDSVAPGAEDDLKTGVENQLKAVFTRKDGSFDRDLFERRVFYTNAFGSLNTRIGEKTPIKGVGEIMIPDENTGVPEFEDALGNFLTDDNRDRDALATHIPKLSKIYVDAENKINDEIAAYDKSLENLEKDKLAHKEQVERLNSIVENIQSTCRVTAQKILIDIGTAYDTYVDSIDADWDNHFKRVNFHRFNIVTMYRLLTTKDEEEKKEILGPVHKEISDYTNTKYVAFEKEINQIFERRTSEFILQIEALEEQLKEVDSTINIDDILNKLCKISGGKTGDDSVKIKFSTFQVILGIIGLDPDIIINAGSGADNKKAALKSIGFNAAELIIKWAFGPVGWILTLGRTVNALIKAPGQTVRALVDKMRPGIVEDLKNGKKALMMNLEKDIAGKFIEAGNKFAKGFNNELEEIEESMDLVIKNLQDENFNLEEEKERRAKLLDKMVEVISNINKAVLGEELNIHGVKAQAFSYEKRQEQK